MQAVAQPSRAVLEATLVARQAKLRQPLAESSENRYRGIIKTFFEAMRNAGAPIDDPIKPFRSLRKRTQAQSPFSVALVLMTSRCSFVIDSRFENKKAKSTGGAIISAVSAAFGQLNCAVYGVGFECRHDKGDYVEQGEGAFLENQGTAPQLMQLMKRLENDQARAKVNITERALAETHEDVQSLYNLYVRDVSLRVMNGVLPSSEDHFDFRAFQTCNLNVMQWGGVVGVETGLGEDHCPHFW